MGERGTVSEPLGQLQSVLDVRARRLPVALPSVAAGTPAQDSRPQAIVDHLGVADQLERLREQRDRRRDRRQPVAALSDVA